MHVPRGVHAQTWGQSQKQFLLKLKGIEPAAIHGRPHPTPTHPRSTFPCNPLYAGNRSIGCSVKLMQGAQALKLSQTDAQSGSSPQGLRVEVSQGLSVHEENQWC